MCITYKLVALENPSLDNKDISILVDTCAYHNYRLNERSPNASAAGLYLQATRRAHRSAYWKHVKLHTHEVEISISHRLKLKWY